MDHAVQARVVPESTVYSWRVQQSDTLPLPLTDASWHSTERANGRKNNTLFLQQVSTWRHQTVDNNKKKINPTTWIFVLVPKKEVSKPPYIMLPHPQYCLLNHCFSEWTLSDLFLNDRSFLEPSPDLDSKKGICIFNSPGHFLCSKFGSTL